MKELCSSLHAKSECTCPWHVSACRLRRLYQSKLSGLGPTGGDVVECKHQLFIREYAQSRPCKPLRIVRSRRSQRDECYDERQFTTEWLRCTPRSIVGFPWFASWFALGWTRHCLATGNLVMCTNTMTKCQ